MGTGEANRPRATSRSTLATRCSSTVRMYVSGRPDWKAPQIALAARLSDAVWVITFIIMDERPRDKDEPRGCLANHLYHYGRTAARPGRTAPEFWFKIDPNRY